LTQKINFIKEHVKETQILREFQIKALDIDFELFLDKIYLLSPAEAKEFMDLISCFINKYIDKALLNKIPLKKQQLIKDVLDGNLDHLIRVVNYKNINYSKAPVVEVNNELELNLPEDIFTIKNRGIENDFHNIVPNCFIDFVTTEGSKVFITGHLYYLRINLTEEASQQISSFILNEETGVSVPLVIFPFKCDYLTQERGKVLNYDDYKFYDYNYDGAGFQIILDFEKMETCPDLRGTNYIILSFENKISSGDVLLKGIKLSAKRSCEKFRYIGTNNAGTITFDSQNIININFDTISDTEAEEKQKKPESKNYTKDTLVFKRMKELEQSKRALEQSFSFKLGRALTWLPRKIRDKF
jgi:hypothetical protein